MLEQWIIGGVCFLGAGAITLLARRRYPRTTLVVVVALFALIFLGLGLFIYFFLRFYRTEYWLQLAGEAMSQVLSVPTNLLIGSISGLAGIALTAWLARGRRQ